jgi:hypothetical protein
MKRALTGVEYLLICMQANSGQSQAYYLRRLAIYTLGLRKFNFLGSPSNIGVGYFNNSSRYKDVLWSDLAPKDVKYEVWCGQKLRAKKSQMHLTTAGWNRANSARAKIGLLPYTLN